MKQFLSNIFLVISIYSMAVRDEKAANPFLIYMCRNNRNYVVIDKDTFIKMGDIVQELGGIPLVSIRVLKI